MSQVDNRILKSQARQVSEMIRTRRMMPSEFSWSDVPSDTAAGGGMLVSRLTHVPTGHYFQFDFAQDSHWAITSPGVSKRTDNERTVVWDEQIRAALQWLARVQREIATPDPWPEFFSAGDLIHEAEQQAPDNRRFTEPEYRDMVRRMEGIRAYLLQRDAQDAQGTARTNEKIDYLITAAVTQGRRDWLFLAMGVLITEVVSRSLDSDEVRHIFELLVRGVQQLTGG